MHEPQSEDDALQVLLDYLKWEESGGQPELSESEAELVVLGGPGDERVLQKARDRMPEKPTEAQVSDAAIDLGDFRSQRAIQPLVKCLFRATMDGTRSSLQGALCKIGEPALEAVEDALKEPDSPERPDWLLEYRFLRADPALDHFEKAKEAIEYGRGS